jgi:hypothetical protein
MNEKIVTNKIIDKYINLEPEPVFKEFLSIILIKLK